MAILSDNMRGATLMAASMAAFLMNDTLIKLSSDQLPLMQAVFLRGLFTTALLGGLVWLKRAWPAAVPKRDRKILSVRVAGEIGATLCFLTALFHMPIANATAILQSLPLAITLAGAVVLGEPVGWRRYCAIGVGFAGVMMIVRPGAEGFNLYALSAMAAVMFVVLRDLTTRRLSAGIPSLFVALLTSIAITSMGLLAAPITDWQPFGTRELALLGGAACFLIFGYLFSVMAMRVGEIAFVSPFRYTILIWAILVGLIVFGDVPDRWTIAGSALIVATGLYTFHRERRDHRLARGPRSI